jgi:hypothetical protein
MSGVPEIACICGDQIIIESFPQKRNRRKKISNVG